MTKFRLLDYWIIIIFFAIFFNVILAKPTISYILIIIIFLSLFILKFNDNLRIVFFLIPSFYYFTTIGFSGNPLTYFLIFLFIKYFFTSKNKTYDINNIILMILVIAFSFFSSLIGNAHNLLELIRWSILFVFTVLLMSEKNSYRNFNEYGNYFIIGFFLSSIVGFVAFKTGGTIYDLSRSDFNPNIINRFSGLSGDPNSYGMYALLVLAFILMKLEVINEPKKAIFTWLQIISIGYLSILTVSRSLIIGFFIIMLLYIALNYKNKKNIKIYLFLSFFMIIGFLIGNNYGFFDNVFYRFKFSDLSELTGSRNIIFVEYMKGFMNGDIWQYLFGSGITGHAEYYFYNIKDFNSSGEFQNPFGTHNTFVELFISFGILGSIIFTTLIYRCIYNGNLRYKNLRKFDFLPIFIIIFYFFSLHNLAKYNFYFILLMISMFLKYRNKNYQ